MESQNGDGDRHMSTSYMNGVGRRSGHAHIRRPVGELLRHWREQRRLTQGELAIRAEVSTRHLSFVETGRSAPSRGMVRRLAEHLALPPPEWDRLLLAAGFSPDHHLTHQAPNERRPAMAGYNELADRYVALWNEKDPDLVRAAVAELWTEDGEYVNEVVHVRGHQAIAEQVAFAQQYYAERGSFAFRSSNDAVGHHHTVKFGWVLVSTENGEAASIGSNFFVLAEDGRVAGSYQFIDKPPAF
ncbi:transcriptional regulator with XRE-family HTH domain [Kitasatospora atroaurantiaca]|uniref:Transcriptional regulator with XRE-family HTH domain n=2 Tax=Kitasatospora atroaurantiaca TaxID=285545 RepID=A0A561EVH1_9ACTN|nr:transcriptional regulator with XRE-family HTH domain [Kitasatospora atroaurantiaca]